MPRASAAIVGVGATDFSKNSGRSELHLAVEATLAALVDAGLDPSEVDGLATITMDMTPEVELARNIGAGDLHFFSRAPHGGGGACAPIQHAAMAVASGIASVVVCYRALNERSGVRFGAPATAGSPLMFHQLMHGLRTPAATMAIGVRRYMHETGATAEDFATVSIAARRHAATNPRAFFYGRPITRDDYLASRMIADPLRLLDCCQESDGAVAVIVTSPERVRALRRRPVLIRGAAAGTPAGYPPAMGQPIYYGPGVTSPRDVQVVAEQLYRMAGLTPADINVAIVYDHFGPSVLPALEAYGFCAPGEAKEYIKGGAIELGGRLPVNPHGGQLGEAYVHGMNGVMEAVRQLRGESVNQVPNARNVLVTAANYVPTSGLILGTD